MKQKEKKQQIAQICSSANVICPLNNCYFQWKSVKNEEKKLYRIRKPSEIRKQRIIQHITFYSHIHIHTQSRRMKKY